MRLTSFALAASLACCALSGRAAAREWTDSTGNYHVAADLIAFNDTTVVLKKENHELIAVPLDKLSKKDQEFLQSKEAADAMHKADQLQTWALTTGAKIVGRVVRYGRKEVTVQRNRGNIYVNDRLYDNLPEIYQQIVLRVVSHFENQPITDRKALDQWVLTLKADPRTYKVDGVMMELENGDQYGIPLFLFSPDALKLLQPGFDRWAAVAQDKAKREQEEFLAQSQAEAYAQDQKANQQIQLLQLQVQAYGAGLFDLWEVCIAPANGTAGSPMCIVVPARDSRQAAYEAVQKYPGYIVTGPIRMMQRLNNSVP
jgi:hypothetical protein